jgi:hypothetical protein
MLENVRSNISIFLKQYEVPLHLPHQVYLRPIRKHKLCLVEAPLQILVTMSVPLSLRSAPLTLYKVIALKMPTYKQDLHVSFIQGLPQFVAYDEEQDWYLEFKSMPQIISDGVYLIERNPTALRHKATPTRFLVMMELDRESIQRRCQFVIQPYAVEEQILVLGKGRLLLQFVK